MGCRPHCRDTKTCPVVPRHALVSFVSGQSSKVCHKVALKAPSSLISLCSIFFRHTLYMGIYGSIWIYMVTYGYIGVYIDT